MVGGRFPGWNLAADIDDAPWCEAALIGSKNRLPFPTTIKRQVAWMMTPPIEMIGIMRDPGRVTLHPWTPDGERVQARLNEVAASLEGEERERLLLEVQARYLRFTLDSEERITLPPNLLANLSTSIGQYVWVYLSKTKVWISSTNPATETPTTIPLDLP